jgi:membrane protease YdiL (CAAX protease family)
MGMKRNPLTYAMIVISMFVVVYIIVDYFNRQGSTSIDVVGERAQKNSLDPFQWNMDDSTEIDSYSSSVRDFYFKDGRAFVLYKDMLHISPQQNGRAIDIERFPYVSLAFYSKESALLIVRLFVDLKKKDTYLVSENIIVHKGWNRFYLYFRDIAFYENAQDPQNQVDIEHERVLVKQIRFDVVNDVQGTNYIIMDFIRLFQQERLDLFASDYKIWGDGRNIKNGKIGLAGIDSSLPAEIAITPIGFDSDVRKLYVIAYSKHEKVPMTLSYRLYDMSEVPEVIEPDARYWLFAGINDGVAEINTDEANLAEIRISIPPNTINDTDAIEQIQIFYERDDFVERFYPLGGLITAPYASGSRMESEKINFPSKGFRIIDITPVSACFEEVNLALSKGYKIVGRMDGNIDTDSIRKTIRIFKNLVAVWAIHGDGARFKEAKRIIQRIQPDAQIMYPGNEPGFINRTNKEEIARHIRKLPNSFVKLDRGPVFFTGIVLIAFFVLMAFRIKTGIGFGFKIDHFKWFGLCLIASVVLLLPMVFIFGLGTYRYITLPDITNALYRYGISAFLQELLRAVAIEYTVVLAMKRIKKENKKYFAALLITSLFFSLGHLGYPGLDAGKELSFLVITLFAGLIFGYLYIKTRSVTPPFILHLLADIFLFVFTTM